MKNQILLILCLVASVFANAQISANLVQHPEPTVCSGMTYELSYNGPETPPYYANPDLPEDGYSYFWYTSDGQTSTLEHPHFAFGADPITVNIMLTPRKKGQGDLKIAYTQNLGVLDAATCGDVPAANTQIWTDHEPKIGDAVYLVIPLKKCGGSNFQASINYDDAVLLNPRVLGYSDLSVTPQGTGTANLSFAWLPEQTQTNVVVVFDVSETTQHDDEVKVYLSPPTGSKVGLECNEVSYSAAAKGGPYDPNYLTPSLGKDLIDCDISAKEITYNLQFQNEGNGPTKTVKLLINLDPRLDPATFRFVSCSTATVPSVASMQYSNTSSTYFNTSGTAFDRSLPTVKGVEFSDMVLQAMSTHYDNSIGYVTFTVRVKNNVILQPGDSMVATTEVYFDNEKPVKTNVAVTSCKKVENACSGKEGCKCKKCCTKPWYSRYLWWILGAIVLLLSLFFYIRKK